MYVTMMAKVLIAMFISLSPNVVNKFNDSVLCDEVEVELIEYSRNSNFSMEDVRVVVDKCRRKFVPTK